MTRQQATAWSWSAITFVIVMAALGAIVQRYTNHLAAKVETNFGYQPDPAGVKEFLGDLEHPLFGGAAPEVMRNAKGRDTFLHQAADAAHRKVYGTPFTAEDQGQHGSCISFGWGGGIYVGACVDWTQGELAEPPLRVATENIYGGSRTLGRLPPVTLAGYSDGSYGAAAARYVKGLKNGRGGVLFRKKYDGVDLTEYSIPLSRKWGNSGVPDDLAKIANEHTAREVALCTSWEELCAAVENGFTVPIASDVGFAATNVRDREGFLPRGGIWRHCMVVIGVRYAKNGSSRDGALILNSHGTRWVTGPKFPADMPDGSFWASRKDIEAILRQGDSFVVGGVNGFAARDLDHGAWFEPAPPAAAARKQPAGIIAGVFSLSP
jgi:hypothetical protein